MYYLNTRGIECYEKKVVFSKFYIVFIPNS